MRAILVVEKVSEQIRLLIIWNALHQETQAYFEYPDGVDTFIAGEQKRARRLIIGDQQQFL